MKRKQLDCYGEEKRRCLVRNYEIIPIRRFYLLPGQTIKGCCRTIDDLVYEFLRKNRQTGKNDIFWSGHGAGNDFLRLLNHPLPPLFNWESCPREITAGCAGSKSDAASGYRHPLNNEVLDALNLFFNVKNQTIDIKKPTGGLFLKINQNPEHPIGSSGVRSINTIYGQYRATTGSLLQELQLRAKGRKVRSFQFRLMHQMLLESNVDQINIEP